MLAGFLDEQLAISSLCRLSDVLASPSDHEPWALVVNEAVAGWRLSPATWSA